jgi:hypothetical protein
VGEDDNRRRNIGTDMGGLRVAFFLNISPPAKPFNLQPHINISLIRACNIFAKMKSGPLILFKQGGDN